MDNLQNRNYWTVPRKEQQLTTRSFGISLIYIFQNKIMGENVFLLLCHTFLTDVAIGPWIAILFKFKVVFKKLIGLFLTLK